MGVYKNSGERATQVAAIRKGIELGINLIDTAEMYAAGLSEEVVGEAIKDRRQEAFLATKVWSNHLQRDSLLRSFEGSLRRLGTSYIDLYQVHWPNPRIPIEETMGAMEELVSAGKIRHIGVSNFSVRQTEDARDRLSKDDITSNQVEYSFRNRAVEDNVLPYCSREKVTLIAYSPLVRGNIHSQIPKEVLDKYRMTPAQAMLNWVTRNNVVVAIPKAASLVHLVENASSVSVRFTESEYEKISAA